VRTAPWVREIAERYTGRRFSALGIHTPELAHERDRDAVARNARRLGLAFPHLVDPDYAYWRALENEYWPTVYLVDGCGLVRGRWIGEVHSGRFAALQAETLLRRLLDEEPGCGT
jgi:hypothetical protein